MSEQYAYTTSRITFTDPQFKHWETRDDTIDNLDKLFIIHFEGIALIGANEKKIYVFRRRPNPAASGYILDLAWQGIQEHVWNYMSRHEILTCYESPDQLNSFIIWAKHPILLYHNPDENQYVSREYKKLEICKDMITIITIIRKHGKMFGIIKDIYKMVYCVEFSIKPWNKHGNLINAATQIIHITRRSKKHKVGKCIRLQYLNQTTEFIITQLNGLNQYTIHINITSMELSVQDNTQVTELNSDNHLYVLGYTYEGNLIGRRPFLQYYIYESNDSHDSNSAKKWEQITTGPTAPPNISPVSTSIWIGSTLPPMDNSITSYMYYYNKETHTLSKFRETYHKVYIPNDDTLVTGFVVYNRIPLRILDELSFMGPSTAHSISVIIQKFIHAKVITVDTLL